MAGINRCAIIIGNAPLAPVGPPNLRKNLKMLCGWEMAVLNAEPSRSRRVWIGLFHCETPSQNEKGQELLALGLESFKPKVIDQLDGSK